MYREGLKHEAAKIWENSLRSVSLIEAKSSELLSEINTEKLVSMRLRIHLNLALYYLNCMKWPKAESHAQSALEIDNSNEKALYRLVIALMEQERFVECGRLLDDFGLANPRDLSLAPLRYKLIEYQRDKSNREKKIWLNFLNKPTGSSTGPVQSMFSCCRRRRT